MNKSIAINNFISWLGLYSLYNQNRTHVLKKRQEMKKKCVEIMGTQLVRRLPSQQNNLITFPKKRTKKKLTSSE